MTVEAPAAYDQADTVAADEIPVVEIRDLRLGTPGRRRAVAAEIARACENVGFFYIAGHGVPQSLVDDAFAQNAAFFALPHEERMRAAATLAHWRGYVPAKLEGEGGGVAGTMETFRLMLDLPPDDPDVVAGKPMHHPNRWPDDLPGFRETVAAYMDAMASLSVHLRHGFALGLGLPEEWFDPFYNRPLIQQSLLHYRPARDPSAAEIGSGEHKDSGAFTILMQDAVGGLEVGHLQHRWIAAPPIPGTFVINIGNMMERWTNGRFVSTNHRVVNRAQRARYSLPYFANPDYDAVIAPVPSLVEPGASARFPPLHFGTFMEEFYASGMAYLRR